MAAINCDDEEALCQDEFQVASTPRVVAYPVSAAKKPSTYHGDFHLDHLARLPIDLMDNFVQLVTYDTYHSFVNFDAMRHKVLLFSNKKGTPALFKSLSCDYKGKLLFGQVRDSSRLVSKFQVSKFPTLIVLTSPDKFSGVLYDKPDHSKKALGDFLRDYAYSKAKLQHNYFMHDEAQPEQLNEKAFRKGIINNTLPPYQATAPKPTSLSASSTWTTTSPRPMP